VPGDLFHLPDNADHYQVFNTPGSTVVWTKPLGISMVYVFAQSSGGGGGGGYSGTICGGGGGGASGPASAWLVPAAMVPDFIYLVIPAGGTAGAAGGNGGSGGIVYGWTYPVTGGLVLFQSAAGTAGQGSAGTASAGGSLGSPASGVTAANYLFGQLGFANSIPGIAGTAGGWPSSTGNSATAPAFQGGTGGGGSSTSSNNAGGAFSGTTALSMFPQGSAGANGNGPNGVTIRSPMLFTGGLGAGSNYNGTGYTGGNGAPGCGGGGGGAGTTGGAGGQGGPGFAIITCW